MLTLAQHWYSVGSAPRPSFRELTPVEATRGRSLRIASLTASTSTSIHLLILLTGDPVLKAGSTYPALAQQRTTAWRGMWARLDIILYYSCSISFFLPRHASLTIHPSLQCPVKANSSNCSLAEWAVTAVCLCPAVHFLTVVFVQVEDGVLTNQITAVNWRATTNNVS